MILRHRLLRNLQVVAMSVTVVAVAAILTGLLWLNQRGFSGEWSDTISRELSALGIHADFDEARFSPLRGILVSNAVIYLDETRDPEKVFARIPGLELDVDRAKAIRGKLVLRKCRLKDADLTIPLTTGGADPVDLALEGLNGNLSIDRQGRVVLKEATGSLGGMTFSLDAELTNFNPATLGKRAEDNSDAPRRDFLRGLLSEREHWHFPPDRAPHIDLQVTGDLLNGSAVKTTFDLTAREITRRNYTMKDIRLRGQFFRRRATLEHFEFSDGAGSLVSEADYDLLRREGRYSVESSIHFGHMLRACFNNGILDRLTTAQAPLLEGEGFVRIAPDGSVSVGANGSLEMRDFTFLGTRFEGLETDFSWRNSDILGSRFRGAGNDSTWKHGDIYLRDLHAAHAEGALTGQVLMQSDTIRYDTESTLPFSAYDSFIGRESGLRKLIDRAEFNEESRIALKAKGSIHRYDLLEWSSSGEAHFENFSFNGVPLNSAKANYAITPLESSFEEVALDFDYTDSPLRRKFGGPARAVVTADRISHDGLQKTTTLDNIRGTAWPSEVLRLFMPKTAAYIARTYRFRSPPSFVTNGTVGAKDEADETDVRTRLTTSGTTNYTLLGRSLSLTGVKADIRVRDRLVDVTDLAFRTFHGRGGGNITVAIRPGQSSRVKGGIHWTRLRLADIGRTYGFEKAEKGYVTGRLDFTQVGGDIGTLNGTGAIGLEQGHLFYVPALGPLSTILGEVVGDKAATHEEARDASCTFAIRRGVFFTRDFLTSTPSSVFTGEGSIDLDRQQIDMTIRMNARGLLGLITLPLRPFNGLFQFRGQGPLKNPTWKRANFVPPGNGENDPIFRTPGKAIPVPER